MKPAFAIIAVFVALSASAQNHLQSLIGDFDGTLEQQNLHQKDAGWTTAPVKMTGRWIMSGHYTELRGTFNLAGLTRPIELVFQWGWDPFQKEYRLVVLDDLVGLVDVFEQESATPLTLSDFAHGTYFQDEHGRSYNRVRLDFLERGAIRQTWSTSRDGQSWVEFARITFTKRGTVPTP